MTTTDQPKAAGQPGKPSLDEAALKLIKSGVDQAMVARYSLIAESRLSGVSFSSKTVAAPTRIGKISSAPSPKVKPSGGVPMQISSGAMWRIDFGKQSQAARMSR